MRTVSGILFLILALLAAALAEEEGCGEGKPGDDEPSSIEESDGTTPEGPIDLGDEEEEKPPAPPPQQDPNRPQPIQVGVWEPPALDEADRTRRCELLARCAAQPNDAEALYALAAFDLEKWWLLQAEEEFLRCAELDVDSIRPFEALLRVYRADEPRGGGDFDGLAIFIGPNGRVRIEPPRVSGTRSWLPDAQERSRRIGRAYEGILRRRPDHLAARREYVAHLVAIPDFPAVVTQARALLAQVPGDADMRYQLAEALRLTGDSDGALHELREGLRRAPDHAPTLLRLARLIARRDGGRARGQILELERRGFFHLFIPREVVSAEYREDTLELALSLSGPGLGARLWDAAMRPAARRERDYVMRWIFLVFPNSLQSERMEAITTLARRSDPAAVGALLGLLWHMEDAGAMQDWQQDPATLQQIRQLEEAALNAAAGQGTAYYPAAERFLKAAATPAHRERGVRLMLALRDARAVDPLLGALAWDVDESRSYGVAAALERLGDARAVDALVDAALDARRPLPRRVEAAEALGTFRDARSIETLSRLGKEQGFEVASAYGLFRLTGDARHAQELKLRLAAGERHLLDLIARCEGAGVEDLLFHALQASPEVLREEAIRLLRERFWPGAETRLRTLLLEEARGASAPESTLRLLGELGGSEAAGLLLQVVESVTGARWEAAARALAETGDPRGERYLNRARIIEKDPARRKLADELAPLAARRRAEREQAAAGR
ncbi:MAG: hypothetical protein ACT4PV_03635 [Planctomycetaceae bacterium]